MANPYQENSVVRSEKIIRFWRSPVYKYAIEIFYSEDDNGYITVVPELAGCSAYRDSEEQALQEIKTGLGMTNHKL